MNSEHPSIPESESNLEATPSSEVREQSSSVPNKTPNTDEIEDIWATEEEVEIADATLIEPEPNNISAARSEPAEAEELEGDFEEVPAEESTEPELFVDRWLDETANPSTFELTPTSDSISVSESEVEDLTRQKAELQQEIEELKTHKEQILLQQAREVQEHMGKMVEEGTKELKERKMALQIEIEKLERRKERIDREMRSNFAGSSQELAMRIQGFKDYLVGSLQDLASAAEKLELAKVQEPPPRRREEVRNRDPRRDPRRVRRERTPRTQEGVPEAQFTEPSFANRGRLIRQLIDKYRNNPDYYGSPWQLRRTFEASQAQKVQEWFFVQGGRGAVDSTGSRLQNILVASAAISILHELYGDRCRVLVLTDTPENLGEWRKGLQDCLGISRSNFGTNRGVVLFDSPDVLVQRAERLLQDKLLPIIVIDETEELLNLAVLKFPLWLAFASTNKSTSANYLY